jgi:hypothetical protein
MRLNNYHVHFYSEIDSYFILGPYYPRMIDFIIKLMSTVVL